jgi:hypothetical protein
VAVVALDGVRSTCGRRGDVALSLVLSLVSLGASDVASLASLGAGDVASSGVVVGVVWRHRWVAAASTSLPWIGPNVGSHRGGRRRRWQPRMVVVVGGGG